MTVTTKATASKTQPASTAKAVNSASSQAVADICEVSGNAAKSVSASVTIDKPEANQNVTIEVESGKNYVLNFDQNLIKKIENDGKDVKLIFEDGSSITLHNYAAATISDAPAELALLEEGSTSGTLADLIKMYTEQNSEETSQDPQAATLKTTVDFLSFQTKTGEIVEMIEPAAGEPTQEKAKEVAEVQPEAGQQRQAQGSISGGGYGYQSTFTAGGILSLEDVGPINPTELQYNIPETEEEVFLQKEVEETVIASPSPTIETDDYTVYEDGTVMLNFTITSSTPNGAMDIVISGIPSDWSVSGPGTFDPAAGTWTFNTTGGDDFIGGPTFAPPADSDVDLTGLTLTVTETNPDTGQTGTNSDTFFITVDAVIDHPKIEGQNKVGDEGETLDIDVNALTGEDVNSGGTGTSDDSEEIDGYVVSKVPQGFTLSAGTLIAPGVYSLTPAEMESLTITPNNPNFYGTIQLKVTVITTENPVTDGEFDFTNNTDEASDCLNLTWKPVIHTPTIEVNGGIDDVIVKEDGSVDVSIKAFLGANPNVNEFLTVTVTGIDNSWGTFSSPVGTYDPATGTWTITLAPGENLDTLLTFSPDPDSDIDLSGLVATVTATDPDAGLSADATDEFNIIVDAVADIPDLEAEKASGDEGTTIRLDITTSVTDTDGSEVIESIKISGIPSGATLTAGTYDAVNDVWILTAADLPGLGINIPDGVTGNYTLTVESIAFEENTSGSETDLSDNRASVIVELELCINPDDVPFIAPTQAIGVDETNLPPVTGAFGKLTVDFGSDTPGTIAGNGTFSADTVLTSNGIPVDITYDSAANTYRGTANGTTIFTLAFEDDGSYAFALYDTLDHPDETDPNDVITLDFGVTATDSNGDTASSTITVYVYDDGVVAEDDNIDFSSNSGYIEGNIVSNDDLSNDQPNTVTKILFQGIAHDVPADGSDITINGDHGALTINSNGDYHYELYDTANGSIDEFEYVLTDADGDSDSAILNLEAIAPVEFDAISVDETDLNPIDVVFDKIAGVTGEITGNGIFSADNVLTSNGVPVDITYDPATLTYRGAAGADTIFTLAFEDDGSYAFVLYDTLDHPDTTDPNDIIQLQFGVSATDSNGHVTDGYITVDVYDDGVVANDDHVEFSANEDFYEGNVTDNDDLSNDEPNTVTQVIFNGTVYDIPADGSDMIINGDHGTLAIDSSGDYHYELYDSAFGDGTGTTYTYSVDTPVQNADAGEIQNVTTTYSPDAHTFTFSMTIAPLTDFFGTTQHSQGFTLAVNNGPNPKGHGGELALFYFDATGTNPIVTVYAYNGENTQNSWFDGSSDPGEQAPDKILSSINNPELFSQLSITTDANGNDVFSFTVDTTLINAHDPIYGPDGEWTGVGFDNQIGMWLHPVTYHATAYDQDGFLQGWLPEGQGWYDTENQTTTVTDGGSDNHVCDEFEYVLTDADGDSDSATFEICATAPDPQFIVGQNVNDDNTSITNRLIGNGSGTIIGGNAADVLVGDAGGSLLEPQTQDYNFVFILDVSGSMTGQDASGVPRIDLLKDAVKNLMADLSTYQDGEIVVHFVPFASTTQTEATFTLSDANALTDIENYIDDLVASGNTNYEDPLQDAIAWLEGSEPLGGDAITTTYFISDGEPNRYVSNTSNSARGSAATVMSESANEIAEIQSLSDEVIAVGINIGTAISNLDQIDSDGAALNIDDAADLGTVFADTNPLLKLDTVGNDHIEGDSGNDIIFGDILFTDNLAILHGLTVADGSGFEAFERLEAGESTLDPTWTRDDTIEYIFNHAEELSGETLDDDGNGRLGGNDTLLGDSGNDIIFGQEGNDQINGGTGTDTLYGGSGADLFIFQTLADGTDTIKDFNTLDGDQLDFSYLLASSYDPMQDDINNFVFATVSGGNMIVSIDTSGSGNIAGAVSLAILEGVTALDIEAAVKTNSAIV